MPRVGSEAHVRHFGGPREHAVIREVHDGGRRLRVDTEGGERLDFVLHPRTAKFVLADAAHGATLELLGP